jgi:phosphohistidine phosphatase SixA
MMPKIVQAILSIFILAWMAPGHAGLNDDLRDGWHVLMMRHADAPGYGDPEGYRLDDCTTQRNLGATGKREAKRMGQWLSEKGIDSAKVLSSPWCRCVDTAKLLDKGSVQTVAALGSFFDKIDLAQKQTRDLQDLIRTTRSQDPYTPLILVTHQVNIQAFTGQSLQSGNMLLVRVNHQGQYQSHQLLSGP